MAQPGDHVASSSLQPNAAAQKRPPSKTRPSTRRIFGTTAASTTLIPNANPKSARRMSRPLPLTTSLPTSAARVQQLATDRCGLEDLPISPATSPTLASRTPSMPTAAAGRLRIRRSTSSPQLQMNWRTSDHFLAALPQPVRTKLRDACRRQNEAHLLHSPSEFNRRGRRTLLHLLADIPLNTKDFVESVHVLTQHGFSCDEPDNQGDTVWDILIRSGAEARFRGLVDKGHVPASYSRILRTAILYNMMEFALNMMVEQKFNVPLRDIYRYDERGYCCFHWLFMMCGPVQFRRLQLYKRHDWLSWRTKVTRRNVLHLWLRDAEFQNLKIVFQEQNSRELATQLILEPDEEQVTPYDLLTNMDPNNADVADIQTMFDQALKRELGDAGGPGFKYKLPIKWKRALSSRRTRLRKSYREQDASHPSASGEDDLDSDDDMFYSASP